MSCFGQYLEAKGVPKDITHRAAIAQLLSGVQLPTALDIIKCLAHHKSNTIIAKGNNFADVLAKQSTVSNRLSNALTTIENLHQNNRKMPWLKY